MPRRVRPASRVACAGIGVALSALVAALPAPAAATGSTPWVAVGGVRVMEPWPDVGNVTASVPVVLSTPAPADVTFSWAVQTGSAGANDIVLSSGTGRIAAGQQSAAVPISVPADDVHQEGEESAVVKVSNVAGATARDLTGFVRIREPVFEYSPEGIVLGDVYTADPDSGSVTLAVPVMLPATRRQDVTVTWKLRSQHRARVGEDLPAAGGTVTIPRGTPSASLNVTVLGDTKAEPRETALLEGLDFDGPVQVIADMWGSVVIAKSDSAGNPLPWTAPSSVREGPPTTLYFESDLGDWVGQGRRVYNTLANSGISVAESDRLLDIRVNGDQDTTVSLSTGGTGRPLREGTWTRVPWTAETGKPWLHVSHNSATCGRSKSTLVVQNVERTSSGTLTRFVLRLEQVCDGDEEPLRLYARYRRGDTTMPPPPGDPADLAWHPPAGAVPASGDYLYLQSSPGEWVGQGQTYLLPIDATTTVNTTSGSFHSWFGDWDIITGVPEWVGEWTRGLYPVGYGAADNPVKAALYVSGHSRGCNAVTGRLAVDSRTFDSQGRLQSLKLRFDQRCDYGPPLYGQLRWTRGDG